MWQKYLVAFGHVQKFAQPVQCRILNQFVCNGKIDRNSVRLVEMWIRLQFFQVAKGERLSLPDQALDSHRITNGGGYEEVHSDFTIWFNSSKKWYCHS